MLLHSLVMLTSKFRVIKRDTPIALATTLWRSSPHIDEQSLIQTYLDSVKPLCSNLELVVQYSHEISLLD